MERARRKTNRKIYRVSFVAEAIISGDNVLNDILKGSGTEVKTTYFSNESWVNLVEMFKFRKSECVGK